VPLKEIAVAFRQLALAHQAPTRAIVTYAVVPFIVEEGLNVAIEGLVIGRLLIGYTAAAPSVCLLLW
jgi:hypothetical protein